MCGVRRAVILVICNEDCVMECRMNLNVSLYVYSVCDVKNEAIVGLSGGSLLSSSSGNSRALIDVFLPLCLFWKLVKGLSFCVRGLV